VGGHDGEDVLLASRLRVVHGRRSSPRAPRRCRRPLDAGVHVRLVVVADVQDILVAFGGAGKGLESDIESAAIAGPYEDGRVAVALHIECGTHAGRDRGAGFERGMVEWHAERRLRPGSCDHAPAARRQHDHGPRSEFLEDETHGDGAAAAGACKVAGRHQLESRHTVPDDDLAHVFNPAQRSSRSGRSAVSVLSMTSSIVAGVTSRPPSPST